MLLSRSIVAAVLFAASALGIAITSAPASVTPGAPFTITWSGDDGTPVTITIKNGAVGNLQDVAVLTSSGSAGSFSGTVPSTVADGTYALEIKQGTSINYWSGFAVSGSTAQSAASSASAVISSQLSRVSSQVSSISSVAKSITSSASALLNATTTSSKPTPSSTRTTSSAPTTTSAPSSNFAPGLRSPAALVLGAIAAMAYLQ